MPHLGLAVPLLLSLLFVGLAMTEPSNAQERQAERHAERYVTVSATGAVSAAPDLARISTGVATDGETARAALDANNKAMSGLIEGLKRLGIETRDIQTTHVAVEPRYQHHQDGRPPQIVGYRVINQVRIVQRVIARLGETIDASITLGANQLGGIEFDVSGAETLKDEARRLAIANARRRAELYATAAGVALDRVLSISETTMASGPRPMHSTRMAIADAAPVEPGEQALSVTVHVTWGLK
jgi:uncharacterized protein YggE